MTYNSSQQFEAYVPVYDSIPEKWEDAQAFLTEQLKEYGNAINIREIGWLLDEELLTGKQFIPGADVSGTSQQFRAVFRKVIDCSPLIAGVNLFPHGITVNSSFSLIQLYAGATNTGANTGVPLPNAVDTITYDATNIIITVAAPYQRCFATIEYIQEV